MNWLAIGYLLLSVLVALGILYGYGYALSLVGSSLKERRRKVARLAIGILCWWIYTAILAYSGILQDFSLPPKFPVLLILPTFAFIAFIFVRYRGSRMIHVIPKSWPIRFQFFRVGVETLFVYSVAAGVLHQEVTIEGYNYDMFVGLSAPIVSLAVFRMKWFPERVALAWNYVGLVILASVVAVFMTTIFFPGLWGSDVPLAPKAFATFPYVLVASFLMPVAVFVHFLSIIQLRDQN